MTRRHATLIGFGAVLLWSVLALLTVAAAPVPPFQLNALSFGIGGIAGLIWILAAGQMSVLSRVPHAAWILGVGGLFGYHALYFTALRLAPPAEASLIAYLWPLLIVLFSGLLPGESLTRGHVIGAIISFIGAAILIAPGESGLAVGSWAGYAAAVACALTWSGYSVLSRRFGSVPTAAVAFFCLAAAALSTLCHLALEQTLWPDEAIGWLAVVGLGLGPVGLAFFVWDIGVKHGDIQLLGTASYAAPLLSTVIMVAAGFAAPTLGLLLAAVLITVGAVLAARAGGRRRAQGGH